MSEEKKTYCFHCDYCNPACTVKYNADVNEEPQIPEACPFGPSASNWKRVEQDQPVILKQEMQHRSYIQEFMEFCKKNCVAFSVGEGRLTSLSVGSTVFDIDMDEPYCFGEIPIESKRAVLLAQLCQAVHEKS